MPGENRYGVDPTRQQGKKDIIEHITEIAERVGAGETAQRIGATSIEDGNLTVRNGDIIVSESAGQVVFRLLHGTFPEMRWFPIGDTDAYRISFFADFDGSLPLQNMVISVETNPGGVVDGGKIILARSAAIFSRHPLASGGNETYIWLGDSGANLEIIDIQGKWLNKFQPSPLTGVYPGQDSLGAGFGSYTHTYFTAFATTAVPIVTLFNSGGTVSWNLTAQSTSSFTVTWSGTTAKTINWWVYRTS